MVGLAAARGRDLVLVNEELRRSITGCACLRRIDPATMSCEDRHYGPGIVHETQRCWPNPVAATVC
jgi:hypothetical protein